MKTVLSIIITFLTFTASAQTVEQLSKSADSSYYAKNYKQAADKYITAAANADFNAQRNNFYYNAACCYALLGDKVQAFASLQKAVNYGYVNFKHLKKDTDLVLLHADPQWKKFETMQPPVTSSSNPEKAQLITTDIDNFWRAYDLAQKDTANRARYYKLEYMDKGSPGLQDYLSNKVGSVKQFVAQHDKTPRFYAAIRKNTLKVKEQKKQMLASFVKLKELYPQAMFPNVYFVIGRFNSAGTATNNGLLLGIDQIARSPEIPTDELNLWSKNNFMDIATLPNIVAHELIHFQQDSLPQDTTLLRGVLVEGMADFLGELISGSSANQRLLNFAKGKEKKIWDDFRKEMYLKRSYNWIANGNQETPDHPADLGYWVGYQICKSYYNNAKDKKQAVHDMLNIKDYRKFYEDSKVEEWVVSL
ncbi:MAG: hypothetical protein EOP46_06540 [Sphingobacteriaceae bacterium]|nr:MAG: hypothetical protein EOP46_06540 [Sphingobacteriaceae bacterium]